MLLTIRHILLFTFCFSLGFGLRAQGWERLLSGGGQDEARALVATPDGGYFISGYYSAVNLFLGKTDADGRLQWTKPYSPAPGAFTHGNAAAISHDGGYIVAGEVRLGGISSQSDFFLLKTDTYGNVVWQKTYGILPVEVLTALTVLPNGNLCVSGYQRQSNGKDRGYAAVLSPTGDIIWENSYGTIDNHERFFGHTLTANGEVIFVGEQENGPDRDVFVVRTDAQGTQIWSQVYGFDFVPASPASDAAYTAVETQNGDLVLAGYSTSVQGQLGGLLMQISASGNASPDWYKIFPKIRFRDIDSDGQNGFYLCGEKEVSSTTEDLVLIRADFEGDKRWEVTIGKGGPDVGYAVTRSLDGGVVSAGSSSRGIFSTSSEVYLVKADDQGRIFTNRIEGNVFHDLNLNCDHNTNEPGLAEWIVEIKSPNLTRYGTTDNQGKYSVLVDTGQYAVRIFASSPVWESCEDVVNVSISAPFDTLEADFPIQATHACPANEVSVHAPFLRRCAENTYTVRYCNRGTIASTSTRVVVNLDEDLSFVSSSIPVSTQIGQTLTYQLGYLEKGLCGSFTLVAALDCDSTLTGESHCVSAHIYPDTFCAGTSNWDGSNIVATAKCENGVVKMGLTNQGTGGMSGTSDFVIIEDVVMLTEQPLPFELSAGQDTTVFSTPANGKTFRIIAEQTPGYPGFSMPTAAIEGCTDAQGAPASLGYFTMFPQDDANPFEAYECLESQEPDFHLPIFKRGYPKGYDAEHYVSTETDLQFLIHFQNTGQDTVRQVIVLDTLSAWLDPATVRPGAASHPFIMELLGGGVLRVAIPNLFLVPNGSASAGIESSGFISFRVSQKPNVPCGTEVLNRAAILFDHQAAQLTGYTQHTICDFDGFITVSNEEIFLPSVEVLAYPNPFNDFVVIELQDNSLGAKQYGIELFDGLGRVTFMRLSNHPTFRLSSHQIPDGFLYYRLTADGRPVAVGKLVRTATGN